MALTHYSINDSALVGTEANPLEAASMCMFNKLAKLGQSLLFGCILIAVLGCNKHEAFAAPGPFLTMSREQVEHVLRPGMETNEIVRALGVPHLLITSENQELWQYALKPFLDDPQTPDSYITAVSLAITNGRLRGHGWVYDSIQSPPATTEVIGKARSVSDATELKFFVVDKSPIAGGSYIDSPLYPKLGYIAATPDLRLDRLVSARLDKPSLTNSGDQMKWSFVLDLEEQDSARFSKFTKDNLGRTIYITIGDKPVGSPKIIIPIENGIVQISGIGQSRMEAIKGEFSKLLKK